MSIMTWRPEGGLWLLELESQVSVSCLIFDIRVVLIIDFFKPLMQPIIAVHQVGKISLMLCVK